MLLIYLRSDISEKYIAGTLLYHSTVYQKTDAGEAFPKYLKDRGLVPGAKVDRGLEPLFGSKSEFLTQGLTDLGSRCAEYKKQGCQFAKWRAAFRIRKVPISYFGLKENSSVMARYVQVCQQQRLVPIVEPEVLPLGGHDIKRCQKVTETVLSSMFRALHDRHVFFEGLILKANMVTNGQTFPNKSTPEDVAKWTITALQRTVPPAVPIILLLSGGQSEEEATVNFNAISKYNGRKPWFITFCYGRALQASALKVWQGKKENVAAAQQEFLNRAKANSEAALGKYQPESVKGAAYLDSHRVDDVNEY